MSCYFFLTGALACYWAMVFLIFCLEQGEDNFKQRKDEQSINAQACVHHLAVPLKVQNVLQASKELP
jgi:hypothetical protein